MRFGGMQMMGLDLLPCGLLVSCDQNRFFRVRSEAKIMRTPLGVRIIFGWGRRNRTLTDRVRVCSATFTQFPNIKKKTDLRP